MVEHGGRREELRSLDRRRMYEIFAPLDADERLPRELIAEQRRFRSVGRRELAGLLWPPALLISLGAVSLMKGSAPVALGAAAATLGSLIVFARSGKPRHP
jgi:hypothetical protein